MKFQLHGVSPHQLNKPYVYDNITGQIDGEHFHHIERTVNKKRKYSIVEIIFGYGCNSNCGYCDQKSLKTTDTQKWSKEYLDKFCRYLFTFIDTHINNRKILFGFWGGEGLLYFDYFTYVYEKIIERYPNSFFCVPTNGRLLKGDIFKWLIEREIFLKVSHEGRYTKELRGFDPFEDKEIFDNLKTFLHEGRLALSPTLHKFTVSELDTIEDIEERLGEHVKSFGDMKFIYPISKHAYDNYAYPREKLKEFQIAKIKALFENDDFYHRGIIQDVVNNIYLNIGEEFELMYHRNEDDPNQIKVHLDGSFTWAHSQHPSQCFPSGESCSYGTLWNMNSKPTVPPRYVYNLFEKKCMECPILAFGDRGCVCMLQYGEEYQDYYCEAQRARILPVFIREFFTITDMLITHITPVR